MLQRPCRPRRTGTEHRAAGVFLSAAVCLALVFALCGCGLEVLDNLAAVNPDQVSFSTSFVTFKHNLANANASFLGYDLYYRLFNISESAQILPIKQAIEALYLSSIGQITGQYNFRKVVSSTQDTSPYIDLSGTLKYESVTVKLDFGFLSSAAVDDDPYLTVTKDSDSSLVVQKTLGRYVVPDLRNFRENGFLNNDYDLPLMLLGQNLAGKTVIACILVVAFGYDQTRSQNLVSQAIFLANPSLGNGGIFQILLSQ